MATVDCWYPQYSDMLSTKKEQKTRGCKMQGMGTGDERQDAGKKESSTTNVVNRKVS